MRRLAASSRGFLVISDGDSLKPRSNGERASTPAALIRRARRSGEAAVIARSHVESRPAATPNVARAGFRAAGGNRFAGRSVSALGRRLGPPQPLKTPSPLEDPP